MSPHQESCEAAREAARHLGRLLRRQTVGGWPRRGPQVVASAASVFAVCPGTSAYGVTARGFAIVDCRGESAIARLELGARA